MKLYHNPKCSKSRQALTLLQEKGVNVEIIEYLKTPPSNDELNGILRKLGLGPQDIIRKGEQVYKENFKDKTLNDEQWINAMVQYPILIERPIFVSGEKAVIGRPPENVLTLL